jgi:hypothetical protein
MHSLLKWWNALGVPNDYLAQALLALLVLAVAAALIGALISIVRWLLAFLNPISSRATPIFTIGFLAALLLAVLLCVDRPLLTTYFPAWKLSAGIGLGFFSLIALTVAAAKLLRFAMVTCAWGAICLVLASQIFFNKLPDQVLADQLPHLKKIMAQAEPEMRKLGAEQLMRAASGG